jgi:hypothetical protein
LHITINKKYGNKTELTRITSIGVDAIALPRLAMKLELKQQTLKLVSLSLTVLLNSTDYIIRKNYNQVQFLTTSKHRPQLQTTCKYRKMSQTGAQEDMKSSSLIRPCLVVKY